MMLSQADRPATILGTLSPDQLAERADDIPHWKANLARHFFSASLRADFYRLLASLIEQGNRIDVALTYLYLADTDGDTRSPRSLWTYGVPAWLRDMKVDGRPFAAAFGNWAPPAESMALRAFDDAGLSAATLRYLANTALQTDRARAQIREVFVKLLSWFMSMQVVVIVMANYIVPKLIKDLPPRASRLAVNQLDAVFSFLATLTPLLVAITVLVPVGYVYALPRLTGHWRERLDSWPIFATYREWVGAQWLRSMAALLAANTRIPQALTLLATHGSPYFVWQVQALLENISLGLAGAMRQTGRDWPSASSITSLEIHLAGENPERALQVYADEWFETSTDRINATLKTVNRAVYGAAVLAAAWFVLVTNDLFTSFIQ